MLGSILGAASSVLGGILGNSAAKKSNKQQAQIAAQNRQDQYNFAQNSLQWKAADAEKAGISKVFAMGASPTSFSPVSVGSTPANFDFLGNAGQNIGRAIQAGQSPTQRATGFDRIAQTLTLEGQQLDNEYKRAQIASLNKTLNQAGQPPGIPASTDPAYGIPGQDVTRSTKIDAQTSGEPAIVPGRTPEVLLTDTTSGGTSFVPPPAMQEALESMGFTGQAQYMIRNGLAPFFLDGYRPKQYRSGAQPGYYHTYNPITGEYHRRKTAPYHNPRSR